MGAKRAREARPIKANRTPPTTLGKQTVFILLNYDFDAGVTVII